jgi:DNA-binding SARP family transcriptional activator
MDRLQVWLFGSPRLVLDGRPVAIVRHKDWALLAYLLMTRKPHTREALAFLFWPDFSQDRARANLRRSLARLHQLLREVLIIDRTTVAVDVQIGCWIDVEQFIYDLDVVRRHPHDPDMACALCLDQLVAARALYVDDFLAGFALRDSPGFDDWHFFEQEVLRDTLRDVLVRLASQYISHNDLHAAIVCTRQILTLDPLHEISHRRLMWLYLQTGQRSAALRQYHVCAHILQTELHAAPEQETVALYQEIAAHTIPRDSVGDDLPLGGTTRHTVSHQATAWPFVGRLRQLAQLHSHLDTVVQGSGKIVFVTGEVGTGKTELLQYFARQAVAHHPTLIAATGAATALAGADLPFSPFRGVLASLAGTDAVPLLDDDGNRQQAARQHTLLSQVIHALLTRGPHLVAQIALDVEILAQTLDPSVLAEYCNLATPGHLGQNDPGPSPTSG